MKGYPRALVLVLLLPGMCFALKPMTDAEIKDYIIKGSIGAYENGQCEDRSKVQAQSPVQISKSRAAGVEAGRAETESYVDNPFVCECPCPFSRDSKGKECGQKSAYFIYDVNKPICYPEDIAEYEVRNFRSYYGVCEPNQPCTQNWNTKQ